MNDNNIYDYPDGDQRGCAAAILIAALMWLLAGLVLWWIIG